MRLKKIKHNKKGAMEMSMGTIVVLVLSMSLLILGLVLIRSIFTGAKYNVETMNKKVEAEIGKLFVEDKKIVVYLANQQLEASGGEEWGVAFGVKNLIRGTPGVSKFKYSVDINNPAEVKRNCGISSKEAMNWIKAGREGELGVSPGEIGTELVRYSFPEGSPLCIIRYTIDVKDPINPGSLYASINYDVNIRG
jgi:hypothetical protein